MSQVEGFDGWTRQAAKGQVVYRKTGTNLRVTKRMDSSVYWIWRGGVSQGSSLVLANALQAAEDLA